MPFVRTAMLNDMGAARTQGSSGELINHFTGVRLRVRGSGNLKMTLFGQDDVESFQLQDLEMQSVNSRSPFKLASFITQRAQLKIETSIIDETFTINRIVVFAKAVATMEPE